MNKNVCIKCEYSGTWRGYLICDYLCRTGKSRTIENGKQVVKEGRCELFKKRETEPSFLLLAAKRAPYRYRADKKPEKEKEQE